MNLLRNGLLRDANNPHPRIRTLAVREADAAALAAKCKSVPIASSNAEEFRPVLPRLRTRWAHFGKGHLTKIAPWVVRTVRRSRARYIDPIAAFALFVLAVLLLCVAVALSAAHRRERVPLAIAASIALAILAGGIAVAGAVRWRDCYSVPGLGVIRLTAGTDQNGNRNFEHCPNETFGLRDPF